MNEADYDTILPYIMEAADECVEDESSLQFKCDCVGEFDSVFPTIYMGLGHKHTFSLKPKDYLVSVSDTQCLIGLQKQTDYEFKWVLGSSFFHSYFTVFDLKNFRMGFSSSFITTLPVIEEKERVREAHPATFSFIGWLCLFFLLGMGLALVAAYFW